MKKILAIFLASLVSINCIPKQERDNQIKIEIKFSPNGGIEDSIVSSILSSKHQILIQAYSFTAPAIANALIEAKHKGIDIQVIVDKEATGNPNSVVPLLRKNNIPVYVDGRHAIAHNKIIIIDDQIVFTGSYNFSIGANTRNAENSLKISDSEIAETYKNNWIAHKAHTQQL